MAQLSKRVSGILGDGKSGWEVHFEAVKRKRAGADILMLSIGDHDFDTPAQTVEACVEALRSGHHHYTDLAGSAQLRAAMARVSAISTGVPTRPENVITTPGGQGALFAATQACLDVGDHAIVVGPYYATYPGTLRLAQADFTVAQASAEDDFEPRRAALEAALTPRTRAIMINSPNNPTGTVYSRATLDEIARFCIEHDLWLISDEVYWTLADGRHVSALSLPGMEARTLVVNSVSKSHAMTGWRAGWLRAPEHVIASLTSLNLVVTFGLADFVGEALTRTLDGDWGVAEIARTYARRRQAVLSAFEGMRGAVVRGSRGGMYVMLDVRELDPDGERFALGLLDAENIAVMPGESFGAAAAGHVRISLVQEDAVLADAAARIRRHVERLAGEAGQAMLGAAQ